MLNPTVPSPDATSNTRGRNAWFSERHNRNTPKARQHRYNVAAAVAVSILGKGISCAKNVTVDRPLRMLNSTASKLEMEVVLRPPPVPLGDAPTIMAIVINASEDACKPDMGTVLNPAVEEALMIWNAAA